MKTSLNDQPQLPQHRELARLIRYNKRLMILLGAFIGAQAGLTLWWLWTHVP